MRLIIALWLTLLVACNGSPQECESSTCIGTNPGSASVASSESQGNASSEGSGGESESESESEGESGPTGECDDLPAMIVPKDPAAECLPDVPCVDDVNCPDGHICNYVFDEPACELLYCGGPGTPCADDSICEVGLRCHEGLCNPCDLCGDRCAIDFDADFEHCGCCDRPVPQGGTCDSGTPICPEGRTLCADACVDLTRDPDHCGACDSPVPGALSCVDGAPGCTEPDESVCGESCVNLLTDDANCGACGAKCPDSLPCGYPGYCVVQSDVANSCNAVCGEHGMLCTEASIEWSSADYDGWCGWDEREIGTCQSSPLSSVTCGSNPSCMCPLDLRCACVLP